MPCALRGKDLKTYKILLVFLCLVTGTLLVNVLYVNYELTPWVQKWINKMEHREITKPRTNKFRKQVASGDLIAPITAEGSMTVDLQKLWKRKTTPSLEADTLNPSHQELVVVDDNLKKYSDSKEEQHDNETSSMSTASNGAAVRAGAMCNTESDCPDIKSHKDVFSTDKSRSTEFVSDVEASSKESDASDNVNINNLDLTITAPQKILFLMNESSNTEIFLKDKLPVKYSTVLKYTASEKEISQAHERNRPSKEVTVTADEAITIQTLASNEDIIHTGEEHGAQSFSNTNINNKPAIIQTETLVNEGTAADKYNITRDKTSLEPTAEEEKSVSKSSVLIYKNMRRSRKNWDGQRYIVYLCTGAMRCAGWGDRQRGIFNTYLLSLVTNRTFKVHMQAPCPLSSVFHSGQVNWEVDPSELRGLTSIHLNMVSNRSFLQSMTKINFNEAYHQDVVYLTMNFDIFYNLRSNPNYKDEFRLKLRGRKRHDVFADLFLNIFKLNKNLDEKVNVIVKQAHPTRRHQLVCAHVRFGRNPTIPDDSELRNDLKTIKPLWKFLDQYSDPSRYRMFVATDWAEFRSMVVSKYRVVAIDVQVDIIHIDRTLSGGSAHSSNFCRGFLSLISDQYVLSQCDILLLTRSGFGKVAAFLRRSNDNLYYMNNGRIEPLVLD